MSNYNWWTEAVKFWCSFVCFLHMSVCNTEPLNVSVRIYHPLQNICRWFYCKYDDSGYCYTLYVPAMDGTSCGPGKVSYKPCQFQWAEQSIISQIMRHTIQTHHHRCVIVACALMMLIHCQLMVGGATGWSGQSAHGPVGAGCRAAHASATIQRI